MGRSSILLISMQSENNKTEQPPSAQGTERKSIIKTFKNKTKFFKRSLGIVRNVQLSIEDMLQRKTTKRISDKSAVTEEIVEKRETTEKSPAIY